MKHYRYYDLYIEDGLTEDGNINFVDRANVDIIYDDDAQGDDPKLSVTVSMISSDGVKKATSSTAKNGDYIKDDIIAAFDELVSMEMPPMRKDTSYRGDAFYSYIKKALAGKRKVSDWAYKVRNAGIAVVIRSR